MIKKLQAIYAFCVQIKSVRNKTINIKQADSVQKVTDKNNIQLSITLYGYILTGT